MSIYIYNGVPLEYFRTTSYEMTTDKDPSNTDVTWNVYTIRGRGFVTAASMGITTNTASVLQFVKNSLEQPRRGFYYQQGNTPVISIGVNNGLTAGLAIDAKLGPWPMPVVVNEVTSGTFSVEHGVVVRLVQCLTETDQNGNPCAPNPVVSLRWNQEETFDENWYSRLVTDGRLIVRSDMLQSADNFRPLATPEILNDYQRVATRYRLSEDGCELAFSMTDQEMDRLPPFPATTASGEYVVVCPRPGTLRMGNCTVSLEGQKGTPRVALLVKAFNMCYAKLKADGFQSKTQPIVWGTFTEDLFRPKVKVSMQANLTPISRKGGFGGALLGIGLNRLAQPSTFVPQVMPSVGKPTYGLADNKKGIAPPTRKRIEALLTAAFSDPCACMISTVDLTNSNAPLPGVNGGNPKIMAEMRNGAAGGSGSAEGPNEREISVSIGPIAPFDPTPLIGDTAPYDVYTIEAEYNWDQGIRQLPGSGVDPDGGISSFVRVHGGAMTLTVTWVAGRTGNPPVLPAYQSSDPNLVALSGGIVAKDIAFGADGTSPTYLVAGYYIYGAYDPTKVSINAPIPPFLDISIAKQIAPLEAAYYSPMPLFSFVGASGPNPFVLPTQSIPNTQYADTTANQLDIGISIAVDNSPTESSTGASGGATDLNGLQGGGSNGGGGLFVGGGTVGAPPRVNA